MVKIAIKTSKKIHKEKFFCKKQSFLKIAKNKICKIIVIFKLLICRKQNYHTRCGKNCHKILSVWAEFCHRREFASSLRFVSVTKETSDPRATAPSQTTPEFVLLIRANIVDLYCYSLSQELQRNISHSLSSLVTCVSNYPEICYKPYIYAGTVKPSITVTNFHTILKATIACI